jgi:hypothetical protein
MQNCIPVLLYIYIFQTCMLQYSVYFFFYGWIRTCRWMQTILWSAINIIFQYVCQIDFPECCGIEKKNISVS